jgi:superoxide reductase
MVKLGELLKEADWKVEKHVPVIECPNTTEHHIRWISLFFHPDGEAFPYHVGHYEFNAHGESAQGPNTSSVYTHHSVTTSLKTGKSGTILALALCNIHGLWQSAKEIAVT